MFRSHWCLKSPVWDLSFYLRDAAAIVTVVILVGLWRYNDADSAVANEIYARITQTHTYYSLQALSRRSQSIFTRITRGETQAISPKECVNLSFKRTITIAALLIANRSPRRFLCFFSSWVDPSPQVVQPTGTRQERSGPGCFLARFCHHMYIMDVLYDCRVISKMASIYFDTDKNYLK